MSGAGEGGDGRGASEAANEAAIRAAVAGAQPVDAGAAAASPVVEVLVKALEGVGARIAASRAETRSKRKTDCNDIGAAILEHTSFVQDRVGAMFLYVGTHWEEVSDATLQHLALLADADDTTQARRGEIVAWLKAKVHQRDLEWGRCADHEIAFANGVLDVELGELRPHRAEDYLENVIPWPWDAAAKAPLWQATLDRWFPPDPDMDGADRAEVAALQEYFGYVLLPHSKFKKALVCFGASDTGKSIVAHMLRAMVGSRFCCTLGVDRMDDPTLCAVLVGKRLNTVTEISEGALVSDGGFKTLISTEEAILINEKYKPAYEYVPHAKHVFVTNNLPRINDRTKAVFNRLLIVIFRIVFEEREQDPDLPEKLLREMPGVLAWAVEGARRLIRNRGKFTVPQDSAEEVRRYMAEMNPFIAFAEECLEATEGGRGGVLLASLTDRFNAWNRGARKTTKREVARLARAAGFTVDTVRLEEAGGASVRGLKGYVLRAEPTDQAFELALGGSGTGAQGQPPPEDL